MKPADEPPAVVDKMTAFEFGVSEFTTWPWTFEQDVERYAALHVAAIEVCEFKLDPDTFSASLSLIAETPLRISSVQPSVRTLFPSKSQPEPPAVPDRVNRFCRTIERFGTFAEGVPFVTNTGIPLGGNIQRVVNVAAREYARLARVAEEYGALLALEPLNPSIMNLESAIWTLEQARQIVDLVDRPNFGVCLDYWNVWQNARIEDQIRELGDRILVVQVSDWRTPRSDEDRLIPGRGEIPLAALIAATRAAGFQGAYSVEIFSRGVPDSVWEADLAKVVEDSRRGLERAWQEATALTVIDPAASR